VLISKEDSKPETNLGLLTICIQQLLLTLSVQGEEQPVCPVLKFFSRPSRMLRTDSIAGQSARFDSEIAKGGCYGHGLDKTIQNL